ncbi:MAG: hypothetical protein IJ680_09070, partial [Paludibacteraceae bacterium]|nr:hypothetical protein [Paludibacteraceae bacterium]
MTSKFLKASVSLLLVAGVSAATSTALLKTYGSQTPGQEPAADGSVQPAQGYVQPVQYRAAGSVDFTAAAEQSVN